MNKLLICMLVVFFASCGVSDPENNIDKGKMVYLELPLYRLHTKVMGENTSSKIIISEFTDPIEGNYDFKVDESTILNFTDPKWSPDGKKIAVIINVAYDMNQLIVLDEDGKNAKAASVNSQMVGEPEWSPNGSMLCYRMSIYYSGAYPEIFITDLETNSVKQITNLSLSTGGLGSPVWSSDGEFIYFLDHGGWRDNPDHDPQKAYVYNIETEEITILGTIPKLARSIFGTEISHDGRYVFGTDDEGILRYELVTGEQIRLTSDQTDFWLELTIRDTEIIFRRGSVITGYALWRVGTSGETPPVIYSLLPNHLDTSYYFDIYNY